MLLSDVLVFGKNSAVTLSLMAEIEVGSANKNNGFSLCRTFSSAVQ